MAPFFYIWLWAVSRIAFRIQLYVERIARRLSLAGLAARKLLMTVNRFTPST